MPILPNLDQVAYMLEHIDDDLTPSIHISSAVTMAGATAAVILRFLARRATESGFGKDDYCLFLGYFFYMSYMIALEYDTHWGFGRHVIVVTDARALVITSILLLYHRIFPSKTFRRALMVLGAFIFAWAMAAFFPSIFTCFPIESTWDFSIQGFCIDYGKVTLVIGVFNIVIDFVILGYPMPMLWRLQMPKRRKTLLSLAFAAGSIACIVSIARLFYAREVESTYDATWDSIYGAVLSGVEMCTAIVACCTVTYRPLIERVFDTGSTAKGSKASSGRHGGKHARQG
ncbi:uncharacterized protein THITE_2084224 [Thermothielavioides terrestris NRRL 8126]|uniref:Rhodopsin domain-containing protein n=1 Tax=Thermothielavioides terrestris (strain ATCC 38088 / NRRL 8126) TaxID=578455 RepID=G2QTA3_THETT|nr:uncharacterized protein THITE_2084224 [Thermothielavioides terrestris NRRL 8126]AEO62720.1 hypothetical protein THITE_2084224 [Thermothielavioides terrestris NRRL 8126]